MKKPKGKFEPIRTIWPYKDGWGTFSKTTNTVMHTGLPTKEDAQAAADKLNIDIKEGKL